LVTTTNGTPKAEAIFHDAFGEICMRDLLEIVQKVYPPAKFSEDFIRVF